MPKKLPVRSARTYSRRQHQAEFQMLLEEEFETAASPDPWHQADENSITALMAVDVDETAPAVAEPSGPNFTSTSPSVNRTPQQMASGIPEAQDMSMPAVAGEPSVGFDDGNTDAPGTPLDLAVLQHAKQADDRTAPGPRGRMGMFLEKVRRFFRIAS